MLTFQLHFLYDVLYIIRHVRGVYAEHFAKLVSPAKPPCATSPTHAPPSPGHMHSSCDVSPDREIRRAASAVHAPASPTHVHGRGPQVATGVLQRPLKTMNVDLPFELQVCASVCCAPQLM